MKRGEQRLAELRAELSKTKREADMIARKLKEKDQETARLLIEMSDMKKAHNSRVSALESRLKSADEWGDRTAATVDELGSVGAEKVRF